MDWDIASSITTIIVAVGMLIVVWWKVKSDTVQIKHEIEDHEKKILLLVTSKAECADLIKLAELVEKIDQRVTAHHEDTKKHRTEDFEVRILGLIKSVEDFTKENREAHDSIIAMIQKLKA